LKTRISALLLALLVVSFSSVSAKAQIVSWASIGVYVRCASGALPSIGTYQGTWQKDDYSQFFHDIHYDGVINGYRAYSYVMAVEGNRSWRVKIDASGYSSGWLSWKFVSPGYSIGWILYRTVSC
jgi:hypothetical protein